MQGDKSTGSGQVSHPGKVPAAQRRLSPVVPEGQQVSLNEVQDPFNPQPERKRLLVGALLLDKQQDFRFYSSHLHMETNS